MNRRPKVHPIKKKARYARIKALRSPDNLTWDDLQAVNQDMYLPSNKPPKPPITQRLKNVNWSGVQTEQSPEQVKKQLEASQKAIRKESGRTKESLLRLARTIRQSARTVADVSKKGIVKVPNAYGRYLSRLDEDVQKSLKELEEENMVSSSFKAPTPPPTIVTYPEPEVEVEEPALESQLDNYGSEGYARRKRKRTKEHKKIKKVKHRRIKHKRTRHLKKKRNVKRRKK